MPLVWSAKTEGGVGVVSVLETCPPWRRASMYLPDLQKRGLEPAQVMLLVLSWSVVKVSNYNNGKGVLS